MKKVLTINADKLNEAMRREKNELKEIEIVAATIKDDLCNYSYEILIGIGVGDTHDLTGRGLVDDDLLKAFAKLNVHLAMIDDVFKHSRKKIEGINKLHGDELALLYKVTGFKLIGSTDSRSVILLGTKQLSTASDWMQLKTPKILLDKFSSYEYHKQLRTALDDVIYEVEEYRGGKFTPIEPAQEKENPNQGKLELSEGADNEFEKGKV